MKKEVKLMMEPKCDFCPVSYPEWIVDGRTKNGGPWALMCPECYPVHGVGKFGIGHGQKYTRVGKDYIKTEG